MTNILTVPAASSPASLLVVLLHGVGADADSFHGVALALSHVLPNAEFLTLDGFEPYDQAPFGRQWFSIKGITEENRNERVAVGAKRVSAFLDEELAKRQLAKDRVVLLGFSQGAIVSAWLATHRAPPPAAVVMFSGRVALEAPPAPSVSSSPVSTPVFMAHGDMDHRISVSELEAGARALEAWGARVTKEVYPGVGHAIDNRELIDVAEFLRSLPLS